MVRLGSRILALKALVKGCNELLKLDPAARAHVLGLTGQSIRLELTDMPLALTVEFTDSGIEVPLSSFGKSSDAQVGLSASGHGTQTLSFTLVKGPVSDFVTLVKAEDKQGALAKSDIEIHGRSGLLLQLANIVQNLEWDWPRLIQPVIGPVLTRGLMQSKESIQNHSKHWVESFKEDVKDYVTIEKSISPQAYEVTHFSGQVSDLRSRTERLKARVQRLQQRATTQSTKT